MPLSRRLLCWFVLGALLLAAAPPPAAAAPRDELLRLVPDDVGFCLVVQDLRGHAAALAESDFFRHLRTSELGQLITRDAEFQKLAAFEKVLEKHLGLTGVKLRDDLLGDAVVLAYRPGPPGKPEQEQGLLLLRARDPRLLADFIDRLNAVQKKSGELEELRPREHHGRKYFQRVEKKGDNFYCLNGPVLALSPQEAMLRQALDLDRTAPADQEPAVARRLRELGADRQLAALWINPPAFTPEIEWKASRAAEKEAAALKHFLACWKALEAAALSFGVENDFALTLTLRARTERLPAPLRKLLAEAATPSELWGRFPADALLAAAGQIDALGALEFLDGFLTPETRQALHRSLDGIGAAVGKKGIREVLPWLGPDVGLCVTAPPAGAGGWFPQAVLAVRVRSGGGDAPVDQALLSAIQSYAMLAVVSYNSQHKDQLVLKTARADGLEVKYLAGDRAFPPGLRPAFALHGSYLLLASSPEAVQRFASMGAAAPVGADEVPLLRMSLKDLRQYLAKNREALIAASAEANQVPPDEARRGLEGLLSVLQHFDRLELTHRAAAGQFSLTLRVQPARALQK
jgi:hypothetical protein